MRTKLTNRNSIPAVIRDMTLEEKAQMLVAAGPCPSFAIPDMDIPSLIFADGVTGVNGTHIVLDYLLEIMAKAMRNQDPAAASAGSGMENPWIELQAVIRVDPEEAETLCEGNSAKEGFLQFLKSRRNPSGRFIAFPSGNNIGAGFNEDRAYALGRAVGTEMRASHLDVCLGPNVDIIRDPLGGRNYEMYGEDPILVSRTAAAFIRGMQSVGTAACAKHFLCNNQETRRQTKNTHVSKRTMRELYAKGFEAAVKEADVKSVMSAYNAVNGIFSSYNKMMLTEWLKDEWGLNGIVVSDWGAVTGDMSESVDAGMDLVLHGPTPRDSSEIAAAVRAGTLSEERVNDAVRRILELVLWQKEVQAEKPISYDQDALLKTAYDSIVDGMVMLKNEGVLPLTKTEKTAFFGSCAKKTMECGSGSTFVTTVLHTNVFDESAALGVPVLDADMDGADAVVFVAGAEGGENADRPSMDLDKADQQTIVKVLRTAKAAGKKTVVILNVAAPVDMREWLTDADAVLVLFVPGCMGGKAAADVLYGEAVPCGRLPMTFPVKLTDSPASPYPTGEYEDIFYSEGIFVGYRWYDAKGIKTQYPFGCGLSYTSFEVSMEETEPVWDLRRADQFDVQVHVKNTGSAWGCCVPQLYLSRSKDRIPMPEKELKAYHKVYLDPGEETIITLTLRKTDLEVYDPEKGLLTPIGGAKLLLGLSAEEIIASADLKIVGKSAYLLGENSSLGELMANEKAMAVLNQYLPQLFAGIGDHIKLIANEKIGALLSRQLIGSIPDANELKAFLDRIWAALAEIDE